MFDGLKSQYLHLSPAAVSKIELGTLQSSVPSDAMESTSNTTSL